MLGMDAPAFEAAQARRLLRLTHHLEAGNRSYSGGRVVL